MCPKKKDFPYIPSLEMGCFDHQSYFKEGSGFSGLAGR